jgi:PPOX class probable FMN-dependent enzyme
VLVTVLTDPAALRTLYAMPKERALRKVVPRLDHHCIHFINRSPLCILASATPDGFPDLSPRGGDPGFVQVLDDHTLLLPDRPGNNRLDSLSNLVTNPPVALLFLVPGIDETLRVYGNVEIVPRLGDDHASSERKPSATVLRISVSKAFFHCAKALMRAQLWSEEAMIDRRSFPTLGQILKDQLQDNGPVESQDDMVRRYQEDL